jgi:DNA primase
LSDIKKIEILNQILGEYYSSGREKLFFCPKCKHHKKKLSINLDKDAFKCWICDFSGKTVRRLVQRYGNYNQQKSWNELTGIVDITEYEKIFFSEQEIEETPVKISLPNQFQSLCNKDLSLNSLPARKYLRNRGISKEDILFWKIGYAVSGEYSGRILVPSFNNEGNVNYFIGRTYENNWRRYLNPNLPKDIIFNELFLDWSSDITIVEGVFDAIKARNAIPILGSSLREGSRIFRELIRNDPAIYIALDPDAEKKAEKLINTLLSYDAEVYKIDIPQGRDVGDMSHEEFLERKKSAKLIKDSDYMLIKKIMSI